MKTAQNRLRFLHSRVQRQDTAYDKHEYESNTRRETNLSFFFKEVNATAVAGCPVVKVATAFHFPPV
jgi:hypothetical protein